MALNEAEFNATLAEWLRRKGKDVATILDWEEEYGDSYTGCPTCGYDTSYCVEVRYKTSVGTTQYYDYEGKFGELLQELFNVGNPK